jgi:hypothetical protein
MIRASGISVGNRSISQLTGVKSSVLGLLRLEIGNQENLDKSMNNEIRTISQSTAVRSSVFLHLFGLGKERKN